MFLLGEPGVKKNDANILNSFLRLRLTQPPTVDLENTKEPR